MTVPPVRMNDEQRLLHEIAEQMVYLHFLAEQIRNVACICFYIPFYHNYVYLSTYMFRFVLSYIHKKSVRAIELVKCQSKNCQSHSLR